MEKYCYYFVNISFPFIAESKDEADKLLEKARSYNETAKFNNAKFCCIARSKGYEFHLFRFEESIPASQAVLTDFTVNKPFVDADKIFPKAESMIYVDLQLTTISQATKAATEAATKAFLEATTQFGTLLCDIVSSKKEALDNSELVEIIKSQVSALQTLHYPVLSPVLSPERLSLGELTNDHLLCTAVAAKAQQMGYTVTSNTSSISGSCNSRSSKYYNSRPDLAMYKGGRMYVLMRKPSEESTTEDTSTSESTLKGGMTENKNKDVEGQLLGGMEKMAGDLAYLQLQGSVDPEQKRFNHIMIYGLVIDYENLTAKAYQLDMNFLENCSTLYTGKEELDLNTGMNRLIACLEHNYA